MGKIDLEKLDMVFAEWSWQEPGAEEDVVTIDGKTLRGSKRDGQTAANLIRGPGCRYSPDGWRGISARRDYGLTFVTNPPLLEK